MLRFCVENYMQRRDFIALLGGVFSWPLLAHAQQKAMPVIGQLSVGSPPADLGVSLRGPIHQGMSEMGFVEGKNMMWEYRWAEGHYERLPALAADLVSHKVDLIITGSGTTTALAARNATSTIPIVFTNVGDPVGSGLVASLARPGGNLTGFSDLNLELTPKRLELLCELVPQATVIALLVNPDSAPGAAQIIKFAQGAALVKGLQLAVLKASSESEIEAAFTQLHADVLLVHPEPFFGTRRDQFVALAARHALPAIYWNRGWVAAGGLISYGADIDALSRQAGIYAGRILEGAKPADLPVQQPTTFKLVINLKTAQALGLTVPPSILARADEVIE
jgi:putative tryptophan/tyrosine transport system substrate-binding protein